MLINISEINEFLYCPRRLYYYKFYDYHHQSYELKDGKLKHDNSSKKGGWIKSMSLKCEELGIKGKIDVVEDDEFPVPIERKRAKNGEYYKNDELQLAGYCLLLEGNLDINIPYGYIYLYSTDERHKIEMTPTRIKKAKEIINKIKKMDIENIPGYVSNSNKCEKCSVRKYCMPEESKILGEI